MTPDPAPEVAADKAPSQDRAEPPGMFAAGAFGLGIALLGRPYLGVAHDAVVYIGQAMAKLDPQGVGQDLMFQAEGQSGFTVFTAAATALVGALGAGPAAMTIGFLGLAIWALAAARLCRAVAPGGMQPWLCLTWMLVAPGLYGGLGVLHIAESFANPRPFAEAGVLAGLAFFINGRRRLGGALLIGAALVHPLIAVAGFGAVWVMLVIEDRRWALAGIAVIAALPAAAALGLPVASRLFEKVDPAWLAVLQLRNPYLLPALWKAQDWARLLAQLTTVAVALGLVEPPARRLLVGVVATAVLGTAVGLFASLVPSLLLLQLQTWRAAWLLAALSAAVTPILVLRLVGEGGRGRLLLALVALAQFATAVPVASAAAALVALAIAWGEWRGWRISPRESLVITVWAALGLILAGGLAGSVYGVGRQALEAMREAVPLSELNRGGVLAAAALSVAALRFMAQARLTGARRTVAVSVVAVIALGLGLLSWDARPVFAKAVEAGRVDRNAFPRGALLWLPDEAFVPLTTGQPAWLARAQGAGDIFSRPLAIEWGRRVNRVVEFGLAGRGEFAPDLGQVKRQSAIPVAALARICADPAGPAGVVIDHALLPAAPRGGATLWKAPRPIFDYSSAPRPHWTRRDVFAIVRCRRGRL